MSINLLIADSGPLIALATLQLLDLPQRLFRQVLVPETVFQECLTQAHLPDAITILDAVATGQLVPVPVQVPDAAASPRLLRFRLDAGETAALAVAEGLRADVLIDERLGRRAAQALGLTIIGVCGLLLLGKRAGHIPELRLLLDRLSSDCGYYLSRPLRAAMIAAVRESAE